MSNQAKMSAQATPPQTSRAATLAGCLLVLTLFALTITSAQAADPIGQVQLILGQNASVQRDGQTHPLKKGDAIYAKDTLSTSSTTHLHLRMQDGAYLALHPSGSLTIECYQTQVPQCLKLDLQQGTLRTISGQASQDAPERFRLNTPIAAVGVRGTDFITQAHTAKTQVRVIQGAITLTPYSDTCTPTTLGNCSTEFTALLTELDNHMLKAIQGQAPVIIELDPAFAQQHNGSTHTAAHEANEASQSQKTERTEQPDSLKNLDTVLHILKDDPDLVAHFIQLAQKFNTLPQDDSALRPTPGNDSLIFGTWGEHHHGLAQPYEHAKQGRLPTVGNPHFAIWRETGHYQPLVGTHQYNLTDSYAYIQTPTRQLNADVTEGRLSINFDTSQLDTQLNIQPEIGQSINFSASHTISRTDGIFSITQSQDRFAAGAISNDAQSVGYILSQPVEHGQLNAQTLWQIQP